MCKYCDKIINYDHSKLKKVAARDCETIAATEDYAIVDYRNVKYSDPGIEDLQTDVKMVRWQDGEVTLFIEGEENIDLRIKYCPFCGVEL